MGSMSGTPGVGVGTTPATPASPVLPPAPASPVLPPRPNTPPPPGGSPPPTPFTPITSVLHAAIGGLGGSSTTTTDPATGITTTNVAVPAVAPTTQQQADAVTAAAVTTKGEAGSVMVTGPKMAVSVGNYPEYDEIKAKNGGKDLIMKDYRDMLIKVAQDYPHLFPGTQKASTYINSRSKPELHALSEKILKEKYAYIDEQDQSANLIQNILRGHRGRGVVTGIQAERATAADIIIKTMREERKQIQQDKFRSLIQTASPILREKQQEAIRRQIMRDTHFNPYY
jgi:hypothetical protein